VSELHNLLVNKNAAQFHGQCRNDGRFGTEHTARCKFLEILSRTTNYLV